MNPLRTTAAALLGLAASTLSAWAFGLGWGPALLLGLTLVALVGLRHVPSTNADEGWPPIADTGSDSGVRREVARLSWSLQGHESRVERPSLLRLRAVADRRLARSGLRIDDPADAAACEARLGAAAYRTLTAGPRAHVTFEQFARSLNAVEQLEDPPKERTHHA